MHAETKVIQPLLRLGSKPVSKMSFMNETQLALKLRMLSPRASIAFAAGCAERLLPVYGEFDAEFGRDRFSVLRNALDFAWQWLESNDRHEPEFARLASMCLPLVPDLDQTASPWAMGAQNGASILVHVLQRYSDPDVETASLAARLTVEVIEDWIQRNSKSGPTQADMFRMLRGRSPEEILRTMALLREKGERAAVDIPLMTVELERQKQAIELLGATRTLDPTLLHSFRTSCASPAIPIS
jgi:uncharacterized protein YjaG (DUF416 family)